MGPQRASGSAGFAASAFSPEGVWGSCAVGPPSPKGVWGSCAVGPPSPKRNFFFDTNAMLPPSRFRASRSNRVLRSSFVSPPDTFFFGSKFPRITWDMGSAPPFRELAQRRGQPHHVVVVRDPGDLLV